MQTLQNGLLISIEGIDGSGKSVLAKNLHTALTLSHYQTILTKEPGGTTLGEKIRSILLDNKDATVCPKAEFLLFAASRAEHFEKLVLPKLKKGHIIISDRMADSSVVYQGYARGLSLDLIRSINTWTMNNITPHLTFYLKIDVETALKRIQKRNIPLTGFEKEQAFIQKTIEGFETLFAEQKNVITLNAQETPELLTNQALKAVKEYIIHENTGSSTTFY